MDRSAVSVAAPLLMRDLKLDAAQMGIIFSAFFAGYALFNFIGGYAADVLGQLAEEEAVYVGRERELAPTLAQS